jgi:Fe2+ or Zn2+ uptake regulation protein
MLDDISALEHELSKYVSAHVHAAETAEGAHRHWLSRQPPTWSLEQVREALRRMTDAGTLERHLLPGGVPLYRAARHEADD